MFHVKVPCELLLGLTSKSKRDTAVNGSTLHYCGQKIHDGCGYFVIR